MRSRLTRYTSTVRQSFWRTVEVYLVRRERIQAGVWTGGVEEIDVAADLCSGLLDRLVGVQIDMLILDRLPEPLDENIVAPASFAIHADGDACLLEPPGEGFTRSEERRVGKECR